MSSNNTDKTPSSSSKRKSLRSSSVLFSPRRDNAIVCVGGSNSPDQASTVSNLTLSTDPFASVTGDPFSASQSTSYSSNDVSFKDMVQRNIEEDMNGGDGGDSDVEGEEFTMHKEAAVHSEAEDCIDLEEIHSDTEHKAFVRLTASGCTDVIGTISINEEDEGNITFMDPKFSSKDIKMFKPPNDWVPANADPSRGLPSFNQIDNPGNWSSYCFKPTFEGRAKDSKYKCHALPTGATPVPLDPSTGKRMHNGWEFFYDGWKNPTAPYRRGATNTNMFPKEMDGSLDPVVLQKLGLTKERMQKGDALFFYQLLLPICDPSRSGVQDDPRKPFYTEVERFTNMTKAESGSGGTYGHTWKQTHASELLRFDGIQVRDGVYGGSRGAQHIRWESQGSFTRDDDICDSMTYTRYCEIKRSMKLCHNGSSPQRGEPNYDPAYKYDLIYRTIIHNCNAITKFADENQTVDETTWGFSGYGEAGSGIQGRLRAKKVPKGGQTVIISDSGRFRPRAYIHRHKLHQLPTGFTRQGCGEMHYLLSKVGDMTIGSTSTEKKIFRVKPTVTADNFFSDDAMLNWAGSNGFGMIGTSARNFLPKDIKKEYLHAQKTSPASKEAKVARFTKPIVAVKNYENYQRVHVSFQSTSSCNISSVNALNECELFVEIRERGRKENKRYWGIEMNHARRLYLSTYFRIDNTDHLLQNAQIFYRTWKYWHAPTNHAKALAIVCAYDIYLECSEGELSPEWKLDEPLSFFEFRKILSTQMLQYSPQKQAYAGDQFMRTVTKMTYSARKRTSSEGKVTTSQVKNAKRSVRTRLCGDIDKLCKHIESVERTPGKKGRICAWCGLETYTMCGLCRDKNGKSIPLHHMPQKGQAIGEMCFYHYHNDNMFGLGKNDKSSLLHGVKGDWKKPTATEIRENKEYIRSIENS